MVSYMHRVFAFLSHCYYSIKQNYYNGKFVQNIRQEFA